MFKVERGCQRYIELSGSHARSVTGRLRSVRYEKRLFYEAEASIYYFMNFMIADGYE